MALEQYVTRYQDKIAKWGSWRQAEAPHWGVSTIWSLVRVVGMAEETSRRGSRSGKRALVDEVCEQERPPLPCASSGDIMLAGGLPW
jgi:hypothetical protein